MQQQASGHGRRQHQGRLQPRTEFERRQPVQRDDDQALMQDVPGKHGLGAVRQPSERAVEAMPRPAQQSEQGQPYIGSAREALYRPQRQRGQRGLQAGRQ